MERDFALEDLVKATVMSYGTIHPAVKELVDCRIVLVRKAGGSKLYKINRSHVLFQELAELLKKEKTAFKDIAAEFVEKIEKKGIENIILFGSVARGEVRDVGDIDLLMIHTGQDIAEEVNQLGEEILDRYDVIISPLYLSKKEVIEKIEKFDDFILNVIDEGEIIYGDAKWLVK